MERRYKIVQMSKEAIICAFGAITVKQEFVYIPIFEKLPKGYEVHDVQYSFDRDCFEFKIWHLSFPVVPGGEMIPRMSDPLTPTMQAVKIAKEK